MQVTRLGTGVPFTPGPDHRGVTPQRLHGREAGPTEHLVVTRSEFAPAAVVDPGAVAGETIYVLLAGELTIEADGRPVHLTAGDSLHLEDGTVRSVHAGSAPASLLVVRAQ